MSTVSCTQMRRRMIYCDDHPMLRYVQNLQCYQFPSKYTLQDALLLAYEHCDIAHHCLITRLRVLHLLTSCACIRCLQLAQTCSDETVEQALLAREKELRALHSTVQHAQRRQAVPPADNPYINAVH
eukprot:10200-Heterococcus_DN1.PRE.2